MPGIISPTGTYSRTRSPRSTAADLISSAMPYRHCSSIAASGRSRRLDIASPVAIERRL